MPYALNLLGDENFSTTLLSSTVVISLLRQILEVLGLKSGRLEGEDLVFSLWGFLQYTPTSYVSCETTDKKNK